MIYNAIWRCMLATDDSVVLLKPVTMGAMSWGTVQLIFSRPRCGLLATDGCALTCVAIPGEAGR